MRIDGRLRSLPGIMPPHILRAIAERGTAPQRAAATGTMALDMTFRALRAAARRHPPAGPTFPVRAAIGPSTAPTTASSCRAR